MNKGNAIVLIFISSLTLLQCHGKDNQISDSERFALEYPLVSGYPRSKNVSGQGLIFYSRLSAIHVMLVRRHWAEKYI